MKKTWINNYKFELRIQIGEKSNITPFMVEHKMFPGNKLFCWLKMHSMTHKGASKSLRIHISVYSGGTLQDEFELPQGDFCKIMSNVHFEAISTDLN